MLAEKWRVSAADAMELLPRPNGDRFATVLEHGSLDIEIYAPRGTDPQKPHTRDEIYFVVSDWASFATPTSSSASHPATCSSFPHTPTTDSRPSPRTSSFG